MLSNRQTHTHTHTQTQLPYPRCACAPRVIIQIIHNVLTSTVLSLFTHTMHMSVCMKYWVPGHVAAEEDIQESWRYVYHLHFLKRAEQTAQKCQRGFVLRQHSPEVSLPFGASYLPVTIELHLHVVPECHIRS